MSKTVKSIQVLNGKGKPLSNVVFDTDIQSVGTDENGRATLMAVDENTPVRVMQLGFEAFTVPFRELNSQLIIDRTGCFANIDFYEKPNFENQTYIKIGDGNSPKTDKKEKWGWKNLAMAIAAGYVFGKMIKKENHAK